MIYFLPIGDHNTASSRLRVWNIAPHLENAVVGVPDVYTKDDVLIIQKTPNRDELERAKSQGAKVIYDIDDYYWDRKEFHAMLEGADIITVDSDKKAEMLKLIGSLSGKVQVIPDSLDWDGTEKKLYRLKPKDPIIGWTGYGNNSAYLNGIKLPKEYTLRLITDTSWLQHYKGEAQSRPWSLDMVDRYLSECDFGMYYLPKGEFEECKGMHKLLKNWAIGLPTYTSPMPDYVKAMEEAGVGRKYIVEDWSKVKMTADDEDIEKCREYALKFNSDKMSELWKETIGDLNPACGA